MYSISNMTPAMIRTTAITTSTITAGRSELLSTSKAMISLSAQDSGIPMYTFSTTDNMLGLENGFEKT